MTTKIPVELSSTPSIVDNGDATAITITSGENVGIGTTTINTGTLGTSNTFLEVAAGTASGSGTIILSRTTSGNNNEIGGLRFVNSDNADDDGLDSDGKLVAAVSARSVTSDSNAGDDSGADLVFYTKPEAGNYAERMRIHSGGCVSIGTSADAADSVSRFGGSGSKYSILMNNNYGGGTAVYAANTANSGWIFSRFYTNGSQVAYLSVSTTGASIVSTGSDLSLKENIEDWNESVLDKFKDIKPVTFNFKSDEAKEKQKGYIAQNELDKFPEAYPFDTKTNKYYFNPSEMTVYLMKAIQEQQAIIEDLQQQINEVKNGN